MQLLVGESWHVGMFDSHLSQYLKKVEIHFRPDVHFL
jgi:hypothetical protein